MFTHLASTKEAIIKFIPQFHQNIVQVLHPLHSITNTIKVKTNPNITKFNNNELKINELIEFQNAIKKTIGETNKKNLKLNSLSIEIIYGRILWCRLTRVADPI